MTATKSAKKPPTNGHHANGKSNGHDVVACAGVPVNRLKQPGVLQAQGDASAWANLLPGGKTTSPADIAASADELRRVPISTIYPSPTNPRKHFDPEKMAELADSIRQLGILQPLLLRPRTKGGYELVAGERRFRAAKAAECLAVPAIVRPLSDRQVRELQLVENLQRADLDPLEEAASLAELLELPGMTSEKVAQQLGKSRSYVFATVKLAFLPEAAKKGLAEGKISRSVAELIARVPESRARKEFTEKCLSWCSTYKAAKEELHRHYMVELKGKPWPLPLANLLPNVPSCTDCAKRTGNAKDLYPGSRPDVCTDPYCAAAKERAWAERQLVQARAEGKKTLTAAESAKAFQNGRYLNSSLYVNLEDTPWEVSGNKTWRTLLGAKAAELDVLAVDSTGKLWHLAPAKEARRCLPKSALRSGGSDEKWKRERAKARQEQEAEERLQVELVRAAMDRVALDPQRGIHGQVERIEQLLRMVIRLTVPSSTHERLRVGRDLWDWEPADIPARTAGNYEARETAVQVALDKRIAGLDWHGLLAFLMGLRLLEVLEPLAPGDDGDLGHGILKELGVDHAKVVAAMSKVSGAKVVARGKK